MMKHLVMSIEGLEKSFLLCSYKNNNSYCKDAFGMTFGQVKKSLQEYKNKGYTVIPGSGCDNIREDGTCGGHRDEREKDFIF